MEKLENIRSTGSMDFDEMLRKSFWKDILYEIISTMDPWDIDIADLATKYSKKIEEMKEMNFRIPANVVIVSSVLLRMKSQLMSFTEIRYDLSAEDWIEDTGLITDGLGLISDTSGVTRESDDELLDSLVVRPKRVPKRRITALELISAIQEVLEDKVIKSRLKEANKSRDNRLVISLDKDIKQLIEETYTRVMEILSKKDAVLFSEIAHGRDEIISVLISLLHLSNKQRLRLRQERIFDEIYIHAG